MAIEYDIVIEADANRYAAIRTSNLAVQNLVERTIKRNEIERLKVTRYNEQDLDRQISNIAINLGLDKKGLKTFLKQRSESIDQISRNFVWDISSVTHLLKRTTTGVSIDDIRPLNR